MVTPTVVSMDDYLGFEQTTRTSRSARHRPIASHVPAQLAVLTLGHDGYVQAFAQLRWELVEFIGAINLDRLLGCNQRDLAVLTTAEMFFEVSAQGYRYG